MNRPIRLIGNSKGILLSRDMLDHLGVDDIVDVILEPGRIVLTAPTDQTIRRGRKQSLQDAISATFEQYDEAMQALASYQEADTAHDVDRKSQR